MKRATIILMSFSAGFTLSALFITHDHHEGIGIVAFMISTVFFTFTCYKGSKD